MIRPLDKWLERLDGVRQSDEGCQARCPNPAHGKGRGDFNPSLSLREGQDGWVLIK